MRLFFAVPSDPETRDAALSAIRRLRGGPGEYRWTEREDLHTTLCFLGETSEERLPALEVLLRQAADQTAPFEAIYGGIGAFDSFDDPRVLWLGIDQGTEELARLAAALGRSEPRPFRGHLTLGWRRGSGSPSSIGAFLRSQPRVDLRRPIGSVALYASAPRGSRPAYRRLLEVPLRGDPALPAVR